MFKVVPDYEFAMVNIEGVIKSAHTGNILSNYIDKDGYVRCSVWCPQEKRAKGIFIHRAKAKVYIPNPENKPCINHKDLNRQNNELDNLEWCTVVENNLHGLLYGDIVVGLSGEDNPNSTLSETEVHSVCSLLEVGISQVEIEGITGVKKSSIFDIKAKVKWLDISKSYNIPAVKKKLNDNMVHLICTDLCLGLSNAEITDKYHLGRGNVSHIKNRKTFKHITELYDWSKVQRSVKKT
tara:strand:- start:311 stop:1024 length:714 start_codon:yes stop_codon:yes gene_type:complete